MQQMKQFSSDRIVFMADTDAAGIVYFTRFLEFAHEAFEKFLMENKIGVRSMLEGADYISPITKAECVYKKSARLEDYLKIEGILELSGASSIKVVSSISNIKHDYVTAITTIEHTFISKKDWKKIDVPIEFRDLCG